MHKLVSGLGSLIIILVIIVCIPLTVPKLLGYENYTVISGSMEPAIAVGSLVYAKPQDAATVEAGQVIVYRPVNGSGDPDEISITHRVVTNDTEKREFITKGDANAQNDMYPVPYSNMIGVVKAQLPFLGSVAVLFASASGKLAILAFLLAGFLLTVIGNLMKPKKKQD